VPKHIAVIDNYDSFTYNLVQYVQTLGAKTRVYLNDQVGVSELISSRPDAILLSPGPGTPDDAGVTLAVISELAARIPILGICLGHQAIGQAFGGRIVRAARLMHGKTSKIYHDGRTLFQGMPEPFEATRYHSLLVAKESLPECLEVSARTSEDEIMGLRHRQLPIEGVQFHPESFLTDCGIELIRNWLKSV